MLVNSLYIYLRYFLLKKNQCAFMSLGHAKLRLAASPAHLFLIPPHPKPDRSTLPSGFAAGWSVAGPEGAWGARLSTSLWVLRHKSPGARHSIHSPHSSRCPLSYEACETATTCVICEYIRLSAFTLMLLRAGLAWAADRHIFFFLNWEEIYNFPVCMTFIYSRAS